MTNQWAFGNGEPGCLHDHQSRGYASKEDATDSATELLELTDDEHAELLTLGCIYFSGDRKHEVGAGMVEVFEHNPECNDCEAELDENGECSRCESVAASRE